MKSGVTTAGKKPLVRAFAMNYAGRRDRTAGHHAVCACRPCRKKREKKS